MKRMETYQRNGNAGQTGHSGRRRLDPVQRAMAHLKTSVLAEYASLTGEHTRLLRLALNEAEALAWQTGHPQLFFPTLAVEKAQTALAWHRRQRALRSNELAFAE